MKVMQADLIREDNPNVQTTVWVECKPKLRENVKIKLKNKDKDEDWWIVKTLYPTVRESSELHDDWCVGGLE